MKKLYLDVTEMKTCTSVSVKDAEVIRAGTTIYSMPVKDKSDEYQRFAQEYDIHFIFDDNIPQIGFYTVPQVDIMATDSDGGYIGTIGQQCDLESDAPICYIDSNRNCYLIAENGKEFLENAAVWKNCLKAYESIVFYNSKADAEKELEFVNIHSLEK